MTNPTTLLERAEALCAKATPVQNWYKHFHRGGDNYGPEDSLRGPFFGWLKFGAKHQAPPGAFADTEDDAKFIAASRTLVPELVSLVRKYQAALGDIASHEMSKDNRPYCVFVARTALAQGEGGA